ncbi:MAG TPA: hypothetical protein VKB34_07525 [Povalibacter sp.]|nr:hypothetical protein [Povalibacter sp.]
MFTDPLALIDQTIDNLETLVTLFEDENDPRTVRSAELTGRAQRCRDAQRAIAFLLPKLRAARVTQLPRTYSGICLNCD